MNTDSVARKADAIAASPGRTMAARAEGASTVTPFDKSSREQGASKKQKSVPALTPKSAIKAKGIQDIRTHLSFASSAKKPKLKVPVLDQINKEGEDTVAGEEINKEGEETVDGEETDQKKQDVDMTDMLSDDASSTKDEDGVEKDDLAEPKADEAQEDVDFSNMRNIRSSRRGRKKAASEARKKVLEEVEKAKEMNTKIKSKKKTGPATKKKAVAVVSPKDVILPKYSCVVDLVIRVPQGGNTRKAFCKKLGEGLAFLKQRK